MLIKQWKIFFSAREWGEAWQRAQERRRARRTEHTHTQREREPEWQSSWSQSCQTWWLWCNLSAGGGSPVSGCARSHATGASSASSSAACKNNAQLIWHMRYTFCNVWQKGHAPRCHTCLKSEDIDNINACQDKVREYLAPVSCWSGGNITLILKSRSCEKMNMSPNFFFTSKTDSKREISPRLPNSTVKINNLTFLCVAEKLYVGFDVSAHTVRILGVNSLIRRASRREFNKRST